MKRRYAILMILFMALSFILSSCSDEDETTLINDLIKKTVGPNIVGNEIQFAYIMVAPYSGLDAAYVEASIPGADGTGFEPYSYYTNSSGQDIGVTVATDCTTTGGKSQAIFIDTLAATLRYHYIIPEEARGKSVSFKFSCREKNGETATYSVQDQKISKIQMEKGIVITSGNRCYISIKNRAAYTLDEVQTQGIAGDIDLIYHYKVVTGVSYGHSLLSPGSPSEFMENAVIPAGANNLSKVEKQVYTFDRQLVIDPSKEPSSGGYSFIDDIDFETYNPGPASSFVLNMARGESVWVISADGKRKAFIQINSVAAGTMTVSLKSYDM
ncbi:MAG: DUF4466 family protein [Mangrovibacterium sp.]